MPTPFSDFQWLDLDTGLRDSLVANLPGLIDEMNALHTDNPISYPVDVVLGISVDMLARKEGELPVTACGIYERIPAGIGEQPFDNIHYTFIVETYLAGDNLEILKTQSVRWATVLIEFFRRFGSKIVYGFRTATYPVGDTTYVLRQQSGKSPYRQLVNVNGVFIGSE